MNAVQTLLGAGLTLRADGDRLVVRPSTRLTPSLRKFIVTNKHQILESVRQAEQTAVPASVAGEAIGTSLMSREQGDACHTPCWSDDEIALFVERRDRLVRWGRTEQQAENLAERLTLRDREQDDRRLCAECRHSQSTRCPDGAPLPAGVLHRCGHFSEPSL